MRAPIYLDHHATTPVDPRVLEAMLPYFGPRFGNAASRSHMFGWEAEKAVDAARQRIAGLAGATPREVVFTSGATESNNLALKGTGARHIVTMATEHRAVLDPAAKSGARVTLLRPHSDGLIDLDALRDAIEPGEPTLVSVMAANNEIGVRQPLAEIGRICREKGALFHCDAAQAFGKIPLDLENAGIDLLAVCAHKMYGPKGVGALIVRRRRVRLTAQMDGGGHESGMRSGTLNVPGIVGFGEAAAIATREMDGDTDRTGELRDRLLRCWTAELDVVVHGSMERRLAGNLNLSFVGVNADALMVAMPEVAVSTGSACSSATASPSHVLQALGVPPELTRAAVRFGVGRFNTAEEIEYVAGRVVDVVHRLRAA